MTTKTFDTIYGDIICTEKYDPDTNESFFDMTDKNGGYYGELHTDDIDELTSEDIAAQIEENMY